MINLCPWCRREQSGSFYQDGDNLQSMRPPLGLEPSGYYLHVDFGKCTYCEGRYTGLTVTMFDRSKNEEIENYLSSLSG